MPDPTPKIVWTLTDEAPALATRSLLPIVRAFAAAAGVEVEAADISVAARILAGFADRLPADQQVPDALGALGREVTTPGANIIKLPNVSASLPQLKAAIEELQAHGYDVPDHPDEPATDEERDVRARYDKVKGSAVNPVLREGNSDRRAPASVKAYARSHPHSMGAWSADSRTHVAHMTADDFRSNERSTTMADASELRIELRAADGTVTALRPPVQVLAGEVVDATVMRRRALEAFFEEQIADAKASGILFSLHLKATMMKVSDPIIFGAAVTVFLREVFDRHGAVLDEIGANPNDGLGEVLAAVATLPDDQRTAIEADIQAALDAGPALAMVDSDRGITNLHVPSDVIVDASMPAMIRTSGQMWDRDGAPRDTKAVLPDSSYAGIYQVVLDDCRANGAFDPATMGTVPNVGLMAKQAEEYGSHDKTFEIPAAGEVRVIDGAGAVVFSHDVEEGDIWRMCQAKDAPIRDWVRLAVTRSRTSGMPAIFWLDEDRAHDAQIIAKVRDELASLDTTGLEIDVLAPVAAIARTLGRVRRGEDTISVTGNVLRDYLTDLFPILELGTSAKMLSIVPLMAGGGLFETGAGGSAPKHVQQLVQENHLRWDSLGEFLALGASLEHLAVVTGNPSARVLADALDRATGTLLEENRSPSRKVGEIDNRGSHAFLARCWAQELAAQDADAAIAERFAPVAAALVEAADAIDAELLSVQGAPVDLGGYYQPDLAKATAAMRPSPTLNAIIDALAAS